MIKTKNNEKLVSEHEDRTGVTFSGAIWVLLAVALIVSSFYAAWVHFKGSP